MGSFSTIGVTKLSELIVDSDLDMNNFKIINLKEGLNPNDATNLKILLALI
ncbi:MAG: hypothetical protein QXH55_05710 [Candidatus Korarchaeota archaeon]|nr:hypothetical protein [Thermoproteota archaeon]